MHLGEYAWIIAFGDEILRCKISHHISLAPLDSFSSRRSLGPYHAFGLLDKSMAYLPSPPLRGTSPKGRGKGVFANFKQSDKQEFADSVVAEKEDLW